jgi:phosphoribosylformylglycinamidine cyclo-ligase
MHRTFNMGVGMVVVCAPADALSVKTHLDNLGETCYTIGRVTRGAREVILA